MIKASVDKIDLRAAGADIIRRGVVAQIDIGREIARSQAALIASKKTPAGTAQKKNSAGWSRAKGPGKPPLYNTGRLANPGAWIVRQQGRSVIIEPPADRRRAVVELETAGYHTVFGAAALPPEALAVAQGQIDQRMADFDVMRHTVKETP